MVKNINLQVSEIKLKQNLQLKSKKNVTYRNLGPNFFFIYIFRVMLYIFISPWIGLVFSSLFLWTMEKFEAKDWRGSYNASDIVRTCSNTYSTKSVFRIINKLSFERDEWLPHCSWKRVSLIFCIWASSLLFFSIFVFKFMIIFN